MAIIKNIYGDTIHQDDLATVRETLEAWIAEFRAKGERPNLRYADLHGADLGYADLRHANLRHADLGEANLGGADLHGADLGYADLRHADLRGANLRGANLRHADLHGADLGYADLGYADLRHANLRHADLGEANLGEANMGGANLSGANLYLLGSCSRGYGFYLYFEPHPVIRAGCRTFTMAEATAHWTTAHEDNLILRAEILGKLKCAKMIIAAREAAGYQND